MYMSKVEEGNMLKKNSGENRHSQKPVTGKVDLGLQCDIAHEKLSTTLDCSGRGCTCRMWESLLSVGLLLPCVLTI